MLSGSAPAMADAKIILSRKLASDWSSPELAQILEQRPGFYEEVSRVFSKLEKAIKMRVLLSFLAVDRPAHKDVVRGLLDEADQDDDKWVKAVSALVRDQLFQPGEEGAWQEGSNKQKPPFREIAEAVLAKSGLGFQGEREEEEGSQLLLPPEPYFSPVEYLYLSSAMIQREQVSAPLTREDNPHFTVSGLDLVRLEPVRDAVDEQQEQGGMRITGPSPLPPMMAPAPQEPTPRPSLLSSQQPQLLRALQKPSPAPAAPKPAKPSTAPSAPLLSRPSQIASMGRLGSGFTRPSAASTAAGSAARGGGGGKDKGTLKRIDLAAVAAGQAKRSEVDVKVQQEMAKTVYLSELPQQPPEKKGRTSPAEEDTSTTSAQEEGSSIRRPAPLQDSTPPLSSAASVASEAGSTSLGETGSAAPPPPLQQQQPLPFAPVPPSSVAAAGGGGGVPDGGGRLADYFKYTEKRNRLTPEDDHRMRQFFELGNQAPHDPSQPEVRIKINEEMVTGEDGRQYRETLYVYLNYANSLTKLSKKKKLIE